MRDLIEAVVTKEVLEVAKNFVFVSDIVRIFCMNMSNNYFVRKRLSYVKAYYILYIFEFKL